MTSVGFQDTQAQYRPSEFLHILSYCQWFLPWRKLVRSASSACRFCFLCLRFSSLKWESGFLVSFVYLLWWHCKIFGREVWFLWTCVDWLGQKTAQFDLCWDSGYLCNAASSAIHSTTTNGVCGIAFTDSLETAVSEIVSVSEAQLNWEVGRAGVMVQWLQMSFLLWHS